jgi:hypothetical protein
MHRSKVLLFDQLIGSREKRGRHGETERLSGLEIDHEFNFGRLLNWKLSSLLALENSTSVNSDLTIALRIAGAISHETTRLSELIKWIDRRHAILQC